VAVDKPGSTLGLRCRASHGAPSGPGCCCHRRSMAAPVDVVPRVIG
jgi:hypothetical protein